MTTFKKDLKIIYCRYYVINLNNGKIVYETEDINTAREYKKELIKNYNDKFGIQQQQMIARLIK